MRFKLKPRTFKLPAVRFVPIRIPYVGWQVPRPTLPGIGRSPLKAAGIAILVGGGALVVGIWFTIQGISESPSFPDPGIYVGESSVGQPPPRALPGSLDYTFPARTDQFTLTNIEVGKSGVTNVFEISTSSPTDYIYVQHLTADAITCPRLIISTSDIATATFFNNRADGHAFVSSGGTPDEISVGTRGARDRAASGTSYDKIVLRGNGSNALVHSMIFTNIRGFGGACDWSNLKIGSLYVANSIIGTGDGIDINDLGFGQSVVTGTVTESGNVETEISVK